MARKWIGLNIGGQEKDIATGTSDLSKDVQIVVDDTNAPKHNDTIKLIELMLEKVMVKKSTVQ